MKMSIKYSLTMVIVCLLTLAGLYGLGIAAHKASKADKSWSRQAEETFYLSPGTGEKILSRSQWDTFMKKMGSMEPEQLASFRLETHMALMGSFHDQHPTSPTLMPNEGMRADVRFNPTMKFSLTPIAARAAAGSGTSATAARAAASLGGSTPVTGTSGAASGSVGGTGALVGIPTPTTGTSGPASGASGGTNAFADSGTPTTGSSGTASGSIGGTAALVGTPTPTTGTSGPASGASGGTNAFADSGTPTTGTSGTVSGSIGGTAAFGSFSSSPSTATSPAAAATAASLTAESPAAATAAAATAPSLTGVSSSALIGSSAAQTALGGGSIPVTGSSGTASGSTGATAALGSFTTSAGTTGVVASTTLSPLPAALPITPTSGSGSVCMLPIQAGAENYVPMQSNSSSEFGSAAASPNTRSVRREDPTTSDRRSVDSYDDSRGAIFHKDFDIGGGNRDNDRNYW